MENCAIRDEGGLFMSQLWKETANILISQPADYELSNDNNNARAAKVKRSRLNLRSRRRNELLLKVEATLLWARCCEMLSREKDRNNSRIGTMK